jgi:predicted alternative tryptophan synthase beta-subunit
LNVAASQHTNVAQHDMCGFIPTNLLLLLLPLMLLPLLPGEEALLQLAKIGEKPDVVVRVASCGYGFGCSHDVKCLKAALPTNKM